jgi:hypothetical protein
VAGANLLGQSVVELAASSSSVKETCLKYLLPTHSFSLLVHYFAR